MVGNRQDETAKLVEVKAWVRAADVSHAYAALRPLTNEARSNLTRRAQRMSPLAVGLIAGSATSMIMLIIVCTVSVFAAKPLEQEVLLPRLDTIEINEGPLSGARVVTYVGSISENGNSLLVQRLEHTPKDRPVWVGMNTGGGDVRAAIRLLNYLNQQDLGMLIGKKGQCASACVLLYAKAARRFAFDNSYFGFHYKTSSKPLFDFGTIIGSVDHLYSMADDMDVLASGVPGHVKGLSPFFRGCSHGDPSLSRNIIYLSWQQITSIAQDHLSPNCDDITGQNSNWLIDQVASTAATAK